jgi:LAS superfamily LD-carboxypeptidase LdcB
VSNVVRFCYGQVSTRSIRPHSLGIVVTRILPRPRALRLLAVAVIAGVPLLAPARSEARPGQEQPTETDEVGPPPGGEPYDSVLRATASASDVVAGLEEGEATVQAEVAAVGAAQAAVTGAQADVDAAKAAVEATEARIADLTAQSDAVVVDAFMNPPQVSALDVLEAETPMDATVKQAILDRQAAADADVLAQLEAAQEELDTERAAQDDAVAAAKDRAEEADAALNDLTAAQSDASRFVLAVQDGVASGLAEAAALDSVDPATAEAIRQRQAEVQGKLTEVISAREQREAQAALQQAMAEAQARAATRQANPIPRGSLGASGGLGTVSCPGGGSITMAASVTGHLQDLVDAASADGIDMCGGGYRDPADQVAVRRANCGTSYYAIYEAPSSACSPPTAPPGTSQHEQGLAVDFTIGGGTISRGSAAFNWLKANAAGFGFYNLPAEPWHWSTTGN